MLDFKKCEKTLDNVRKYWKMFLKTVENVKNACKHQKVFESVRKCKKKRQKMLGNA